MGSFGDSELLRTILRIILHLLLLTVAWVTMTAYEGSGDFNFIFDSKAKTRKTTAVHSASSFP